MRCSSWARWRHAARCGRWGASRRRRSCASGLVILTRTPHRPRVEGPRELCPGSGGAAARAEPRRDGRRPPPGWRPPTGRSASSWTGPRPRSGGRSRSCSALGAIPRFQALQVDRAAILRARCARPGRHLEEGQVVSHLPRGGPAHAHSACRSPSGAAWSASRRGRGAQIVPRCTSAACGAASSAAARAGASCGSCRSASPIRSRRHLRPRARVPRRAPPGDAPCRCSDLGEAEWRRRIAEHEPLQRAFARAAPHRRRKRGAAGDRTSGEPLRARAAARERRVAHRARAPPREPWRDAEAASATLPAAERGLGLAQPRRGHSRGSCRASA